MIGRASSFRKGISFVITRMSKLFVRTLRDDPAAAEIPSHRFLVRAGYIRRVAPGIYSWLPLGLKVLQRVENIVREEMDAMGGQEVLLPALLPVSPMRSRIGGRSMAPTCSAWLIARVPTCCSDPPMKRCSPCW